MEEKGRQSVPDRRNFINSLWIYSLCKLYVFFGCLSLMPIFVDSQLCTKSVKVPAGKSMQKVPMIRRIPGQCSNWDRAWVWLTNLDCGTKYVTEYINFPSRDPTYRIEYVCCPDDSECTKAAARSRLAESDERFLAITFGSATAVLALLCLVFFISFCHKRRNRFIFWKRNQDDYETTNGVEPVGCNMEGTDHNDYVDDDLKLMESEYEEICDINGDFPTKEKIPIQVCDEHLQAFNRSSFEKSQQKGNVLDPPPIGDRKDQNLLIHSDSAPPVNVLADSLSQKIDSTTVSDPVDVLHLAQFNPRSENAQSIQNENVCKICDTSAENIEQKVQKEDVTKVTSGAELEANAEQLIPVENKADGVKESTPSDDASVVKNSSNVGANMYESLDQSKRDTSPAHMTYDALILTDDLHDYQNVVASDS